MGQQALPTRFPCWCKAVYSWGGETKRDLGFIEGDLIECLNAGDGSWWMGRLRRDRRMVGLFPSNFVELLPENYSPAPIGSGSPMPSRQNSANSQIQTSQKQKSTFRKPFQAYYKASSPNPAAAQREIEKSSLRLTVEASNSPSGSVRKSLKPYSAMKRPSNESSQSGSPGPPTPNRSQESFRNMSPPRIPALPVRHQNSHSRAVSPQPYAHNNHSRAVSPAPYHQQPHSRAVSPAPYAQHSRAPSPNPHAQYHQHYSQPPQQQYHPHSRQPSPNPYQQYHHSRAPSPQPEWEQQQAPPPPPPTHRYVNSRAPSPQPYTNGYHTPDPGHSPAPGLTPSPIANAMNDVMNCIEDMTIAREPSPSPEPPKQPSSVWSPDAFDELYPAQQRRARPHTTMELGHTESYKSNTSNEEPSVGNYVQRMEERLRRLHEQDGTQPGQSYSPERDDAQPPEPPPKEDFGRPKSSLSIRSLKGSRRGLRHVKSGYDIGKQAMSRTFTLKSTSTNATDSTNHTLMSGTSAGGFSATSAGSFYRKKLNRGQRPMSVAEFSRSGAHSAFDRRPTTPMTGISYHSSHDSNQQAPDTPGSSAPPGFFDLARSDSAGVLGGLSTPSPPKQKKSGFFKKMIDSAKTGAANARSTISSSGSRPASPVKMTGFAGGMAVGSISNAPSRPQSAAAFARPQSAHSSAARDMGLGGGIDWVQVRRDVNRSNSISRNERVDRAERCQMLEMIVMQPTDELYAAVDGDEGADGLPISDPTDFQSCNLQLVDKTARFVNVQGAALTVPALVQGYLCRPYRSDVQRLRAIFTWVSERIAWEDDFEIREGDYVDTRRVLSMHRGCNQEIAYLVAEMCASVGIHSEVIRGYLKTPGEPTDYENAGRPNHWWNAVIVDGEWRMMDCALASPTHTRRKLYSSAAPSMAEGWYFLTRPMEICFTHVPLLPEQQHLAPPVDVDILMALPTVCTPYFRNNIQMADFCTSLLHLENLEMAQMQISVPDDVECVAETEVRAFARDMDGDFFESGDVVKKPALAQAEWVGGRKRITIKALLPGDEGQGVLKIYAGKRGLMHSIKSNPHPLAMALPLTHTGMNPPYDFFIRHPTPHAQRHDLYVIQPQCLRLVANNTFIFSVRQHPSTLTLASPALGSSTSGVTFSTLNGRVSPNPFQRPASAMSMASFSQTSSNYSSGSDPSNSSSNTSGSSGGDQKKPAKLAIQSPGGKIIRLTRKSEHMMTSSKEEPREGSEWETVIKVGERGVWRGLVLADRSARWCVFAEWECT